VEADGSSETSTQPHKDRINVKMSKSNEREHFLNYFSSLTKIRISFSV